MLAAWCWHVVDKLRSYQSCVIIIRSLMLMVILLHHTCEAAGIG